MVPVFHFLRAVGHSAAAAHEQQVDSHLGSASEILVESGELVGKFACWDSHNSCTFRAKAEENGAKYEADCDVVLGFVKPKEVAGWSAQHT